MKIYLETMKKRRFMIFFFFFPFYDPENLLVNSHKLKKVDEDKR